MAEEYHETRSPTKGRPYREHPKEEFAKTTKQEYGKKEGRFDESPKPTSQEEFKSHTSGTASSRDPFTEDTYYSKSDYEETETPEGKTKRRFEVKSESHIKIMSDKKVEIHETTDIGTSPEKAEKVCIIQKDFYDSATPQESRADSGTPQKAKDEVSIKSPDFVKETIKTQTKISTGKEGKSRPAEPKSQRFDKRPEGTEEEKRHPVVKTGKRVKQSQVGPQPKVEFPESDVELERGPSPDCIPYNKFHIVSNEKLPEVTPKEQKTFSSQPPSKDPPSKAPFHAKSATDKFENLDGHRPRKQQIPEAVGLESTKVTKIADKGKNHQRFVSMQQTTRLIRFTDSGSATAMSPEAEFESVIGDKYLPDFQQHKPLLSLEPFPFNAEEIREKRDRGVPPSKPKKFEKRDFKDSDYDSDFDGRLRPKWQPQCSDVEDPVYHKVRAPEVSIQKSQMTKERTPTPPTVFDTPPSSIGPMRPVFEPVEKLAPVEKDMPPVCLTDDSSIQSHEYTDIELSPSCILKPGTPPEEGVITRQYQFVVDSVDVHRKVGPSKVKPVSTIIERPYVEVTERIETTLTKDKMEKQLDLRKERTELVKTRAKKSKDLEEKTDAPQKLKKEVMTQRNIPFDSENSFVRERRLGECDNDQEPKIKPKCKPINSDLNEPVLSERKFCKEKQREPTPPSEFEPHTVPLPSSWHAKPCTPDSKMALETATAKEPSKSRFSGKAKLKKAVSVSKPEVQLPEKAPESKASYIPTEREKHQEVDLKIAHKPADHLLGQSKGKREYEIDIDIVDMYDLVTESDTDRGEKEENKRTPFPELEPFPFKAEPERPKRPKIPPPPTPKKFVKGEFKESDYENDYERQRIFAKWIPPDSEGEEPVYRRVAPPMSDTGRFQLLLDIEQPMAPSEFEKPLAECHIIPRRERRESLEEYSIPKFPKVEFKPYDLDSEATKDATADVRRAKEVSTYGLDETYAKSAQKFAGEQFEDMTESFRSKAQKFAEQLVTEVFATKEGPVVPEAPGEPQETPSTAKSEVKTASAVDSFNEQKYEPQVYRDESRVSEFGTKLVDPDTGLIYFKYDFGYEFGVILPGEGKKMDKRETDEGRENSIPIPVIHLKSDTGEDSDSKTSQFKNQIRRKHTPRFREGVSSGQRESLVSPEYHPQSDASESEYREYMGRVIPSFVPRKQAQFRPISDEPFTDSEVESEVLKSPLKCPELQAGKLKSPSLTPGDLEASGVSTDPSHTGASSHTPLSEPIAPPIFITPLRDVTASVGEAVKLECVVQGGDAPSEVLWFRDGSVLTPGPNCEIIYKNGVCRLIIPRMLPGDIGMYACDVTNAAGTDSTRAVLKSGEKTD